MDYFTELLESYSRLKQRKLVLLEKKAAGNKPAAKKAEVTKPDKIIQEYTPEQVITAALKSLPAKKPISKASFKPIPGLMVKDEEGNEIQVLAYQTMPKQRAQQDALGLNAAAAPKSQDLSKASTNFDNLSHGNVVAWAAAKGGANAVVVKADGSPQEPAFTHWYEKYFLGKEAMQETDGTGLENAIDRVGESLKPILTAEGIDDSLKAAIFNQVRNMVRIASDLVLAARDIDTGYAKKPWAGWKEGEDGGAGRYVGQSEEGSDDPEMTRSVGSYISGRSAKSLEYQIAHGKTVEFDETVGVQFDDLARDPILIQGALDSVQAFMELGKANVTDKEAKCVDIGRRVKRKGDRLIFFRNEDLNQGIAIKRNDMFQFVESQILEHCGSRSGIKRVPEGTYSPAKLNDLRGKGFEHGAVAVGVIPNLQAMPEGTPDEIEAKDLLFKKFAKYLTGELLEDEAKFSAAYIKLEESEGVALSTRALFVTEAMTRLRLQTNTPNKARAFFQRVYDMEKPVVNAMKPDFTFPLGLKTGIGYADDLAYAYKSPADAEKAAEGMNLQKDNAVHSMKVSDLKKELERGKHQVLGEIFQAIHTLKDDDKVYLVGSSQKSYYEDGTLKFGESLQRSAAVQGTAENMAPGFEEVTMQRLGIDADDLASLRDYQDQLDSINTSLDDMLPKTGNVAKDSNGKQQPINFNNIITMVEDVAAGLSLTSDARTKLKAVISDYQGNATNLNGPDNVIQRAELKNELSRILTTTKQYQDITSTDPTDEEIQRANGDAKLTAIEIAAKRVRDAKLNLAYSIHMGGGTLRDGVLNKKVFNDNSVRAGSHMAPLNTNTLGLINDEAGHTLTISNGMLSLSLNGPEGNAVNFGAERSRAKGEKHKNLTGEEKGLPVTRNVVTVNVEAQKQDAMIYSKIDRSTLVPKEDPRDNPTSDLTANTLQSYIVGQMKLLEELMKQTN